MRSAEAVKEIHERNTRFKRRQMRHARQVHNLLDWAFAKHCETSLTRRHNILMVAKNTQCMRSQCTSRHMEHAWKVLPGYLVHIRYHKEQALWCCVSSGKCTCLQRAMNCTRSAAFRLHLFDQNSLSKNVLTAGSSPLVNIFSHCRRWRDRINRSHLWEHIANMCGSLITITGQEFLFFTHIC